MTDIRAAYGLYAERIKATGRGERR
jgi:hypothetical protein